MGVRHLQTCKALWSRFRWVQLRCTSVRWAFVSFVPMASAFCGSKCDNNSHAFNHKKLGKSPVPVDVRFCTFWPSSYYTNVPCRLGCLWFTFSNDVFLVDGQNGPFSWEIASGGLNKFVSIPYNICQTPASVLQSSILAFRLSVFPLVRE